MLLSHNTNWIKIEIGLTMDNVRKKKTTSELKSQGQQLRRAILEKTAKDGGHVSSPLGAIEIIQALMNVFDFTQDKITFDTGHQMHAYKLLTGRTAAFATMDKHGGIGEYANIHESPYDFFTGGHCGTAISAALGYAVNHPEYKSIAFIGDGAMTGGQPYEALNQAGALGSNLLIVYNDNDYSVTENTGFLHAKKRLKKFSQSLGFEYIGVLDGHNTRALIRALRAIKIKKHPIFLHIKTLKGKGYQPAEDNPSGFHLVEPFELKNGTLRPPKDRRFTNAVIKIAHKLKARYPQLHMVSPAAAHSSGLLELKEHYPNHVFDTGINEQHCVTFSAGLALNKNKVICFIPATFLPRALDQIIDICLLKVPMVFVLLKPGIAATGPTHQGIYTFPLLNMLPNAQLYNPANLTEFEDLLTSAIDGDGPIFIQKPKEDIKLPSGDNIVEVRDGKRLTVISLGNTLSKALKLSEKVDGVRIVQVKKMVPLNMRELIAQMRKTKALLVLEDGLVKSGIGQHIVSRLAKTMPLAHDILGVDDIFPGIGTLDEVYQDIGLSDEHVLAVAKRLIAAAQ